MNTLAVALLVALTADSGAPPTVRLDPRGTGFAALSVPDLAASQRWYQRHFWLKETFTAQPYLNLKSVVILGGSTNWSSFFKERNTTPC